MAKRILDVGNCSMDHGAIRGMLVDQFQAEVLQAHGPHDTLETVRRGGIDLVLINRKLDADYTDGVEIVKLLKQTPETAHVPVMLVTNLPEYDQEAVAAGATPGFGKKTLYAAETRRRLAEVLDA